MAVIWDGGLLYRKLLKQECCVMNKSIVMHIKKVSTNLLHLPSPVVDSVGDTVDGSIADTVGDIVGDTIGDIINIVGNIVSDTV